MSATAAARRMDRIYRYQRLIYNATRRYYLLGRTSALKELAPPPNGDVLEIGCGTAWNLIRAAKRYPQSRFHGLDVSPVMLETAQRSVHRAGLDKRIQLAQGDATSFDAEQIFGVASFDCVLISYSLSMIPAWRDVLINAMRLAGQTGSIHIVDFGQCERWPSAFKSPLYTWLDLFHVSPRVELEQQLQLLAEADGRALQFHRLYGGYAVMARID